MGWVLSLENKNIGMNCNPSSIYISEAYEIGGISLNFPLAKEIQIVADN